MKKFSFLLIFLLVFCASCAKTSEVKKTIYAFDTVVSISYAGSDSILEDITNKIEYYSHIFDDYKEYENLENIATLNKNREIEYNADLYSILEFSCSMENESFSIFLGKLNKLWKEAIKSKVMPDTELLNSYLTDVKNTYYYLEDGKIKLRGNADIDLGSVAKGYALSKVLDIIKEANIRAYIISFGMSTIAVGEKENGKPYKVLINNTNKIISLKNKCISVSGIDEQSATINGQTIHHLIDAKTGMPGGEITKLVVIGDDPLALDYESTALFFSSIDYLTSLEKEIYAFINDLQVVGE